MTDSEQPAALAPIALLHLMSWLSPAFPVGSYSYSHGIEQAVEAGLVRDWPGVVGWLSTILRRGGAWIDAGLFCEAHRAVVAGDRRRLHDVARLAEAWRSTAESALEARAQGTAFVAAWRAAWPGVAWNDDWNELLGPSYAVAVALATAQAGIPEAPALTAFLHGVTANLVLAAVRLIPLGQTDGQRALAALTAILPSIAAAARITPLDDLGTSAPMVDWTGMRHETQYTRLFRS